MNDWFLLLRHKSRSPVPFARRLAPGGDLKNVSVSITIENNRDLVLTQNFPDVQQLAQFLKENPQVAKKVGYVNKNKKQ